MVIDAVGLFVYIVMLRFFTKFSFGVKFTALVIGIAPLALSGIYRAIIASINDLPLSDIFSLAHIIMAVIQLVLAFIIVSLLRRYEDDLSTWFIVATIGGITNYVFVFSLLK